MSSIVAEVLQGTGKLAKENIVLKINDLKKTLEDVKIDVQENLKNQYIDFSEQYMTVDKLISDLDNAKNEHITLCTQIEKEIKPQMISSVVEFNDVVEDLKKIKKLQAIASQLCQLHQSLEAAKGFISQGNYLKAIQNLLNFEEVFQQIDAEYQNTISIIVTIRREFIVTREDAIYRLETQFREGIKILTSLDEKNPKISIRLQKSESMDNGEMLLALNLLKQLKHLLKEFGQQFLCLVCETILLKTVQMKESADSSMLSFHIHKDHAPDPSSAFDKLKKIFTFLHEGFFSFPISSCEEGSWTALSEFGVAIGDEFCSLIIEKCLKVLVPKQSNQLETFKKEVEAAEEFCKFLQHIGFISYSENKLLNFIHDVDILPVNKMSQDLLRRARSLMQKSLHQTVIVGTEVPAVSENKNEMANPQNNLSWATFMFPRCQVSQSVENLLHLLLEVKEEAKNIGPNHSIKLYYVARNICDLYCCVVPTYHKTEIETIPQQTAIFHNNCMYLAHHLSVLGTKFESALHPNIPVTFVDLVPEIKKLGTEAFLAQMRLQKQQLLQLLQEHQARGSILIDDGDVANSEKAIRQCLCQLQLLRKVWSDVLPMEVYFRTIGTLFSTCLEEIILRICSMEDIAAEAAAQLDSIFAIILKQGPDLFQVPSVDKRNSVDLYVSRWFKFQELQLILSASMREIVDRWASGKGPLASHFTSEEVKHLIRALFQNTERRAAALAKIK